MFKEVPRFVCPLCQTTWNDLQDAEACREDCANEMEIEVVSGFACSGCDYPFDTKDELLKHFLTCKVDNCATCEHCDAEGYRSGPCRAVNGSAIIPACEHYTRAHK